MASNDNQMLGVVLIVRDGDQQGSYQNPTTYDVTGTQITPLGNQQEYQLGQLLRSIYLNASSPSYIPGMSTGVFEPSQVSIRADAGGQGGVIYSSCVSLTQGLWPATPNVNITLANGTTIAAPTGYQNILINAVNPNLDVSLDGSLQCNAAANYSFGYHHHGPYGQGNNQGPYYGQGPNQGAPYGPGPDQDAPYGQFTNQSAAFLQLLPPYVGDRPVSLDYIGNIFDYMNVNNIHNATFAQALPPTFLAQTRALADIYEYRNFSDRRISGIGNIGGQTLLPSILNSFQGIVDQSNPVKMAISAVSYRPIISLFSMTGVTAANPQLAGIADYASAVALEVRQPSGGGEPVIRFNFKNGSADFATYGFMGQAEDVPLSTFINTVSPYTVNTTAAWCNACQNSQDRGCGALTLVAQQARAAAAPISPIGAGFLGAGLGLAVILAALAMLAYFGRLSFRKKPRNEQQFLVDHDEVEKGKSPSRRSSVTLVK